MGRTSSTRLLLGLVGVVLGVCLTGLGVAGALDCPRNLGCGLVGCACGDTVVADFQMTGNITCPGGHAGFGLRLASGVELRGSVGQVFQIIGPATMGAASDGILIDNAAGASVLYVRVTGFRNGVRAQNSTDTILWNVQAVANGAATDSAGIAISGGSGANVYACTVENNADVGIRLTTTSGAAAGGNLIRYNAHENIHLLDVSGTQLVGNTTAGGSASVYAQDSSTNVLTGNSFADGNVVFAGSSSNNDFGKDGIGNSIIGGRLEFRQVQDGAPTINRALKPEIFNSAAGAHCIDFAADPSSSPQELPSGNTISEATLTCGAEEIHVTAGAPQGSNILCACEGTGGGACDVALDPDAPDIIAQFAFPCL